MTRLADDRRGRVPFALVGALLLVGSATFGAALSTQGPARVDHDVDMAMERTTATTTTALRSAIGEATQEAASEPLTASADTPYGRLLSNDTPFRDALRLRIYRAVEERLSTTQYRRGDVTAVASLPAATTPPELRDEMGRIEIQGVENGTALRVTVRNITITARESGRVVASEERTRTVTVSTPVLALHDRATTFETRLNRGPLDGPGLGRRLTARLYPVAWARGWGQYYGAPIANVVSNRHVETSTNGAVLETQREVFGRSDPAGRQGMRYAMAELAVRDFTAATSADSEWAERVLVRPNPRRNHTGTLPNRRAETPPTNRTISVDIDPLASHAAAGMRTDSLQSNRSLKSVLRAAYRVETELRTARRQTHDEPRPELDEPGEEWSLTDVSETATATVNAGTGSTPSVHGDEHRLDGFVRNVELERRVTWRWSHENDTTTTSAEWTDRYRIGVTVVGTYAPNGTAPDRPTRPQFEQGGPLDGPNLADVAGKAKRVLVERRGGRDTVATEVATGELNASGRVVYGDRPADLRPWTNANLSAFGKRLDATNVSVEARGVATYGVNPPKRLAASLRERRSALVDAPKRYRGAADRARVGARVALLDATIRRLERRSASHNETRARFESVLDGAGIGSTATLRRILDTRETPEPSSRSTLPGSPPGGPVGIVPHGSPSYLTVASVGHERATGVPPSRSYQPLSAKNVNLFAAPYSDAADTVAGSAAESSGVRLRSGAQTLRASSANGPTSESSQRLRQSVAESVDVIRSRSRRAIRTETNLSRQEAAAAVSDGTGRWDGPANRALAASNGSLAEAIAVAADERASGTEAGRADRLEAHLDATIVAAQRSSATRVSEERTDETRREIQRRITNRVAERGGERVGERVNETLEVTPAGLPVAPVPGYWYATVNVWTVEVKGAYARFTLRTRRGAPEARPGSELQYVRDGSPVRFDVDGDGDAEHVGRDERIDFETETVVTVAVPAYRSGVGDVDGNADERSGTWPRPECTSWSGACDDTE